MSEPRWVELARDYLGTAEVLGSRNNKDIVAMHQAVSGVAHPDSVAWCSAFANYVLNKSGVKGTGSLMARSFSRWGDDVKGEPPVGAVVVLSSSRGPASGHVGFCVGVDSAFVHLLGGNQGDKVSIAKFPKGKIVAVRWPKGEPRGAVKAGGCGGEVNPRDD
jgi:uncharacterized protein (TIGR02594 family)